jgi:hypothetical protein
MRRSNTDNIGSVIAACLVDLKIDEKLKEVRLINSWEEVIGTGIARATNKLFINNRVLFVYLKSSVVRNELMMLKSSLLKALNDKAGSKVIDDIVLR